MLRKVRLVGTTISAGTVTVTADTPVLGVLEAVQWIDGDLADGVDAVLSVTETGDVDYTLLTLTDANNDAWYFVREPTVNNTGAALLYAAAGQPVSDKPIINGKLKLAITSGGDTKTGGAIVYFRD